MQPQIAKKFALLQLHTLRDALWYFPFRHEDWREKAHIAQVIVGQEVTIEATVVSLTARRSWKRRGTTIIDVTVTDDSEARLHVLWFNMPFLAKSLQPGDRIFLSGKISQAKNGRLQMSNPTYERPTEAPLHERLVPVYRSTDGLSQRQIRLVMKQAVALAAAEPDPLPHDIVQEQALLPLTEALINLHFPATPELGKQAVERLKFQELLGWHLRLMVTSQTDQEQRPAPRILFHEDEVRSFVQHLPFELTNDQRVSAWQALQDMASTRPMSRLIQGDVGSGKTVVAALIAYNAILSHYQVAFVAPTVILAEQHLQTLMTMLGKHDIKIALLTGHEATIFAAGRPVRVTRQELREAVASGTVQLLIGTHAILDPDIDFHNIGLVIVDEQQRFGVDQRQALLEHQHVQPHFLSLTATPIPRSFALWLSGILSISTIATKPVGRLPILSQVYGPNNRREIDQLIHATLDRTEQVYVITPIIEESDSLGVRAAMTEYERLTESLPHHRIGVVHGAMPAVERVALLQQFRQHELDLLVSTTVVEVGVDVPNASLMIIEGAERFGLAQLHQLRGRVGRGTAQSTCCFVTDKDSPEIRQRLEKVAQTQDGFAVAELDLQERGSGDLYGQRQSGLPSWQLASLNDRDLFERVKKCVATLEPTSYARLLRDLESEQAPSAFHPE